MIGHSDGTPEQPSPQFAVRPADVHRARTEWGCDIARGDGRHVAGVKGIADAATDLDVDRRKRRL